MVWCAGFVLNFSKLESDWEVCLLLTCTRSQALPVQACQPSNGLTSDLSLGVHFGECRNCVSVHLTHLLMAMQTDVAMMHYDVYASNPAHCSSQITHCSTAQFPMLLGTCPQILHTLPHNQPCSYTRRDGSSSSFWSLQP